MSTQLQDPPVARSPFEAGVLSEAAGGQAPPRPDFAKGLSDAQRTDAGAPAPAPEPKPESKPTAAAVAPAEGAKPKVPALPTAEPAPDYRPKGEASKHWDAMKSKHAEELGSVRSQLDQLKGELAAAKSAGDPEEVKAIRQQLKQYQEILRDVAIERDPGFRSKYETQEKAAKEAAKLAAGEQGDKLEKLLGHPNSPWRDEQLNKLVEDLPAAAQRRVNAALQKLEQIDIDRSGEIAVRRQTFDEKQSAIMTQQKERETAQAQQMTVSFDSTQKEWTKAETGHPLLVPIEGDKEHNERVGQLLALAKHTYMGELSAE